MSKNKNAITANMNPCLKNFSNLMNTPDNKFDCNIGKFGIEKEKKSHLVNKEPFLIIGTQFFYNGNIGYRVLRESDKHFFGSPVSSNNVIFISSNELDILQKRYKNIYNSYCEENYTYWNRTKNRWEEKIGRSNLYGKPSNQGRSTR